MSFFRYFYLLGFTLLFSHISYTQIINNLYFNSTTNILRLNFSSTSPSVIYTTIGSGATIGEGIAHAEDRQGNIIIWVNASGVYDKNGTLMPGSAGILAHPSSTEIVICPFPTNSNKYYIFYNSQLCSSLYYAVVDMKGRSGLGEVISKNMAIEAGSSFAEGLEIVKVPCSNAYWLLTYQCYSGFKRFRIDANGLSTGTLIHAFDAESHNGRGELDYHNGRLGYAVTYKNRVFLSDFDPLTGIIANAKSVSFEATNGIYGLEFSPNGSKVYVTDWNNRNFFGNISSPNLFRYDFNSNTTSSWTIPYNTFNCKNTTVEGLGQIELGKDGRLYIPHVNGCQISVVENPNEASLTFYSMDVNTILSSGVSDHIQSEFLQTQFLHLTASRDTICAGESTRLMATGGSGAYSWYPKEGVPDLTTSEIEVSPKVTTSYKLYAENQEGCLDSVSVTIVVQSVIKPEIALVENTLLCSRPSIYLKATFGRNNYQWYKDNQLISGQHTDSLLLNEPGIYQVKLSKNVCAQPSDPFVLDASFFANIEALFVPNVITPDQDIHNANETFVIKNYRGRVKVVICNRWGKEVYRSEDYQNDWAAEGLANGVYFYYLSHADKCFPPITGLIHVLR